MLSGGACGVIFGLGADAGDAETLTELARRGVAQLVISDTMQPAGFVSWRPAPANTAGPPRPARAPRPVLERAVAMLLGRLHGQTPAEGIRADVGA